jgi:membrane-associated phospholipid phosphatase
MATELRGTPQNGKRIGIRILLVVVGLGLWFLTQSMIGQRANLEGDYESVSDLLTRGDAGLMLTVSTNRFLRENRAWSNALLISSSAVIDLLGGFLLLWAIFGPSLRPFVGLLILFGLRQLSQNLCVLPPPDGIIWEYPGFPSLLVTYGVANDFFFSGHTGIAVYGAVEIGRLKGWKGICLGVAIAMFEATSVLLLRAHYTMDVLTGILAAICAAYLANRIGPIVDLRIDGYCNRPARSD